MNRMRKLGLGLFLSVLLASLVTSLYNPPKASAADIPSELTSGDYTLQIISETHVVMTITSSGLELLFEDNRPFDPTHGFALQDSTCDAHILFDQSAFESYNSGGAIPYEFDFHHLVQTSSSTSCSDEITINGSTSSAQLPYTGYRLDDNNIFMPSYRGGRSCGGNNSRPTNGLFRRYDSGAAGYTEHDFVLLEEGAYSIEQSASGVDREVSGVWVELDTNRQRARSYPCNTGVADVHNENIRIAPQGTAIPEHYRGTIAALGFIIDDDGNVTGGDPGTAATDEDSCETRTGALGWIMCPVAGLIDAALDVLDTQIHNLLAMDKDLFQDEDGTDNGLKEAWTQIRNIAYVVLVPIMLVMVIGTALGFDFFSAYTVRKALPRMVAAIIFIALSWDICVFFIDLFNALGSGARGIITAPFNNGVTEPGLQGALGNAGLVNVDSNNPLHEQTADSVGVLGGVGIVAGAFAFGAVTLGILLSWLVSAGIMMLIGFLALVARQMLIIAGVLLAPLAILAWIFPGNDKLWKIWWNMFSKLLMMFPMILGLIGLGEAFAYIIGDVRGNGAGGTADTPVISNMITIIMVMAAIVLPYLAIPFTFKFAGGVFGQLTGIMNNKGKGLLDRNKNWRKKSREAAREHKRNSDTRTGAMMRRLGSTNMGFGERGKTDHAIRNAEAKKYQSRKGAAIDAARKQELSAAMLELEDERIDKKMGRTEYLDHLLEVATSKKSSDVQKQAAINTLAGQQDVERLQRVRLAAMATGGEGTATAWNKQLPGLYSGLKGISPHLAQEVVTGQSESASDIASRFAGVSDAHLSTMKPGGWEAYAAADRGAAQAALDRIKNNSNLEGNLNTGQAGQVLPPARGGHSGGGTSSGGGTGASGTGGATGSGSSTGGGTGGGGGSTSGPTSTPTPTAAPSTPSAPSTPTPTPSTPTGPTSTPTTAPSTPAPSTPSTPTPPSPLPSPTPSSPAGPPLPPPTPSNPPPPSTPTGPTPTPTPGSSISPTTGGSLTPPSAGDPRTGSYTKRDGTPGFRDSNGRFSGPPGGSSS